MWSDSYLLGVEKIDEQHKNLCGAIDSFMQVVRSGEASQKKTETVSTLNFMKDYVSKHFFTEETYMETVGYPDIERHRLLHKALGRTVSKFEKKIIESDFSRDSLLELNGFLSSWVTYHMSMEDQKIVSRAAPEAHCEKTTKYLESFTQSSRHVISSMAKVNVGDVHDGIYNWDGSDVLILIRQPGAQRYEVAFRFKKDTALGIIEEMSSMPVPELDDLATSTLSELATTINSRALGIFMAEHGIEKASTGIIPIPKILGTETQLPHRVGFYLDTDVGPLAISLDIG